MQTVHSTSRSSLTCYGAPVATEGEADVYALVVGAIVAQLRTRQGMTQGELASKMGVTQPTMSRIERGQVRLDAFELRSLAENFGMSTGQLTTVVDQAYARAEKAAKDEVRSSPKGEWWKTALAVIGGVGLAGLAGFAAAAALAETDKDKKSPRKR